GGIRRALQRRRRLLSRSRQAVLGDRQGLGHLGALVWSLLILPRGDLLPPSSWWWPGGGCRGWDETSRWSGPRRPLKFATTCRGPSAATDGPQGRESATGQAEGCRRHKAGPYSPCRGDETTGLVPKVRTDGRLDRAQR